MLRNLKKSDFKSIAKAYEYTYEEVSENPNFGDWIRRKKPSHTYFIKWISNLYNDVKKKKAVCIVAEVNGEVAGFCIVRNIDSPESERSHVGILHIRVIKKWRGKGLGTKLMKEAIFKSKNIFEIIDLYILHPNKIASHIYKKLGFRRWGFAPGHLKRGKKYIDLEHMYLKL